MHKPGAGDPDGKCLNVLIWGAGNRKDHFDSILAANIQQWGYDAVVLAGGLPTSQAHANEVKADVLVCDLDNAARLSAWYVSESSSTIENQWLVGYESWWTHARLMIALSSRSVPRAALEQLGAVALLHKPFEMAQLQRYLRVLQRMLVSKPLPGGTISRAEVYGVERREGLVRILVVDDHKEIANTIRECLECEANYEVKVANEGLEALEECIDWQPHCIVTDLLMPCMNGYQIMRSLSAGMSEYTPAFVVLSALPQRELRVSRDVSKGKEIVFLDKPFQVNQLLQAVEEALAQ